MNLIRAFIESNRHQYPQAVSLCFLALVFMVLLSSPGTAENSKNPAPSANQAAMASNTPGRHFEASFKASNRRDPFLNPLLTTKKSSKSDEDEEESRGVPPPGIGGTMIAQAVLQGISIRDNGKTAIVRGADTRAYFLREGDRLFDGYLKCIDVDSITLVRETRMKSGKVFTKDVTKRLRTP